MSFDTELNDALREAIWRGSFSVRYNGFEPYLYFTAEVDGSAVIANISMSKIISDLEKHNSAYWEKRAESDYRLKMFLEKEEKRYQRSLRSLYRKIKSERRAAAKAAKLALLTPPHIDPPEMSDRPDSMSEA